MIQVPVNIKNIIFDLGGIFMTLDYQKTEICFEKLGIIHFKDLFNQHAASPVFELLETGKISPLEFYDAFRQVTGTDLTNDKIQAAWNAMLLDFPEERIDWLKEIKHKYNVYLYSNTNQIHHDAFMAIYRQKFNGESFDSHFIKAYYSHEFGYRKPHAESYTQLLNEQQLIASETLFIDDTFVNIVGAEAAGLLTIHLQPPHTVLELSL